MNVLDKIPFLNNGNIFNVLSKIFGLLSLLLLGYVLIRGSMINKSISLEENESADTSIQKLLPSYPPFTQYLQSIQDRNSFEWPKETKVTAVQTAPLSSPVQDLTKKIKILGVMLSKNPQVIVQNLNNNETIVLSQGDMMEDFRLQKIEKNSIVFEKNGESYSIAP